MRRVAPRRARNRAFVRTLRTVSLAALLLWCIERRSRRTLRYGNTSIIPWSGSHNYPSSHILFIRTSDNPSRWGDLNFVANMNLQMSRNSRQNAELFAGKNLLEHVRWHRILHANNNGTFTRLIRRLYCTSCRLNAAGRIGIAMRDTRLFYHDTSEQRLICAITYSACPTCSEVICFRLNSVLGGENPHIITRRIVPIGLASRNAVPIVRENYQNWDVGNMPSKRVWFLDVSGAHKSFPLFFPVSIVEERQAIWSYERSIEASGCSSLEGWRGSVPVIHLAEENVWITLAHRTIYSDQRNHANDLGRQYEYKFVLFRMLPDKQSKAGFSCQCFNGSDDLYVQGLPTPFVFLLGMEYIGIKGMYHNFIISGSIDDRAPFLAEVKLSTEKIEALI
jgi:hypothetical protein